MSKSNPYNLQSLNNIRARNSKKKNFRPSGIYGCEICWLTYIEDLSGSLGVCVICEMKCKDKNFQEPKPIQMKF